MNFTSKENKDAILYRLDDARRVLKQPDYNSLLSAMLDLVMATHCPLLVGLGLVQCLHWLYDLWKQPVGLEGITEFPAPPPPPPSSQLHWMSSALLGYWYATYCEFAHTIWRYERSNSSLIRGLRNHDIFP